MRFSKPPVDLSHRWQGFLGALVTARASAALLPQYIAVKIGLRRSLDDWIPADHYDKFAHLLTVYGLVMRVDCVFTELGADESPAGSQYAPTTKAAGRRWRGSTFDKPFSDSVHVIVAPRSDWADEALHSAWYPVSVNGSVIRKPLADHRWLGQAFGYPTCCVEAFINDNDWHRKNMYAEAVKRSNHLAWQTNCFPKLGPWTTVFHIPCTFDCPCTIEYTRCLLSGIARFDTEYKRKIELAMRLPVLSFSERSAFAIHNASYLAKQTVRYDYVTEWCSKSPCRQSFEEGRLELLNSGDRISLQDGCVIVHRGKRLKGIIVPQWNANVVEISQLCGFE